MEEREVQDNCGREGRGFHRPERREWDCTEWGGLWEVVASTR
jgi:hypothetical protein